MVEAVIALPVLCITLIGVTYVHDLYVAKQQTLLDARMHAWQKALAGCSGGSESANAPASGTPGASDTIDKYVAARVPVNPKGTIDTLSDVPVVGSLISTIFPVGTDASSTRQVHRPAMFVPQPVTPPMPGNSTSAPPNLAPSGTASASTSGDEVDIGSRAYFICNEEQKDPHGTTIEVFTDLAGKALGL